MEFESVIRERFSVRKFKNEKILQEQLDKILEAWRLAPTAKNIQPQKIYVVQSEEWLQKIDQLSPCRYGSNTVLLVCSDKESSFHRSDGYSTYCMDASIVTTHMMLEATNIWVDSIRVEMFDPILAKELFCLPKNLEPVCLMPLWYRQDDCTPSHLHSTKKDNSDLVIYV